MFLCRKLIVISSAKAGQRSPGFPVQQAGSEGSKEVPSMFSPSSPGKTPESGKQPVGSSYWLGPPKSSVQGGKQQAPQTNKPQLTPKGGYRSGLSTYFRS